MAKVGQEIEVPCGRCKEERYHTVVALRSDGRIESVVCNFCHTEHKYRAPAVAKARTTRASAPRPRRAPVDVEDDSAKPAKPYSPLGTFDKGDVLMHAKYGLGRVVDVRGGRIDVRFADGFVRVFVHVVPTKP